MSDTISPTGFTAPDPTHLADLFPGYEIVRLIACGGMGAVYEAMQIALDRTVAIKILPREFTNDESFRIGFQAEARAMARLNHPNLISVYDFGEVDGMLYIIMEYVPGFSLFEAANGQPILQEEVVPLVASICRGLAHAHDSRIIHRDIKPANILLNLNNEPKIGDFGLARPLENQLQEGEEIFGTPGYTAPEVIDTPHSIDHRADIFSLGVLLHELLTGILPNADPRPTSAICHCDPRFDLVIRKATHESPTERYDSANEIAAEIERISTTAGPRVLQTAAHGGRAPRVMARKYTPTKKSGSKGFLISALLIAVGIVGYFFLNAIDNSKEKQPPITTPTVDTQPTFTPPLRPATPLPPSPPEPVPDPVETPEQPETGGIVHWGGAVFTSDDLFGGIQFSVNSGAIGSQDDQGVFAHEIWQGDGLFTLEIAPITTGPSDAKAGLMIRENLESDARNVFLARNSSGETILQLRSLKSRTTAEYTRITTGHRFLRIHRSGDSLTAVASRDGDAWVEIGTVRIPELSDQIHVGFAAASATHASGDPLEGRYQPVLSEQIDTSLAIEGSPAPRINMNERFLRARNSMKERAMPLKAEFEQLLKASNDTYIQQSESLAGAEISEVKAHHTALLQGIELGGFIPNQLPAELAAIPNYLVFHNTSVERQRNLQQNHTAKMAELAEVYLNGIENQIQRFSADNDLGAVNVFKKEKERLLTLPYYFRHLMEENG